MTKYTLLLLFTIVFVRKLSADWYVAIVSAFVFTLTSIILGEIVLYFYRNARKTEQMANRRDAMFFIQEWIDSETNTPFLLHERFENVYLMLPKEDLEVEAAKFIQKHLDAGNQCFLDLPDELCLPVRVIYARAGGNRMETSSDYLARCEAEIIEVNNNYHKALADVNSTNYLEDVLRNPHNRSHV